MMMRRRVLLLLLLLSWACAPGDAASQAQPAEVAGTGTVVDSVFPMPVMIERFQQKVGAPVTALPDGSATSRDSLVARFVRAVEDSSATALRSLRLDARAYAYLYVPTSRLSAEPYRQPPELGWMLVEQNGLKGELRVLRRFGGRSLEYRGYTCDEPVREGPNTLWERCVLDIGVWDRPIRLFGSIMERGGRYSFVSIANDL